MVAPPPQLPSTPPFFRQPRRVLGGSGGGIFFSATVSNMAPAKPETRKIPPLWLGQLTITILYNRRRYNVRGISAVEGV